MKCENCDRNLILAKSRKGNLFWKHAAGNATRGFGCNAPKGPGKNLKENIAFSKNFN
jgi:hypothetical protein